MISEGFNFCLRGYVPWSPDSSASDGRPADAWVEIEPSSTSRPVRTGHVVAYCHIKLGMTNHSREIPSVDGHQRKVHSCLQVVVEVW